MINIRIIKLPSEANKLARKIEDTIAKMIGDAVKSKISVDNQLKNLEITVYEQLITVSKGAPMKITKKKLQDIIEEEIKNIMAEDVAQEPVGGGRNRRGAVGKEWLKNTVQKLSKLINDLDGDYSEYLKQIEERDVIITKSTLNHILNGIKKDISNLKSGIPGS